MKNYCWLAFLTAFYIMPTVGIAQDTISIEIGEKAKIWMYAPDKESFKKLGNININKIVRDIIRKSDTLTKDKNLSYEYEYRHTNWWETEINIHKDSTIKKAVYRRSYSFWNIDIGLNNYLESGKIPNNAVYSLSPTGSRYFAMGLFQRWRLGNKHSPLSVQAGLEVSWYNFMFEKSNYITIQNERVEFRDYIADFGKGLSRNKLVVPYFNIPVMFNARFNREGVRTFQVGIGGYVGYRLNSYAMVRPERNKIRTFDNFELNSWRYGLELQVGYKDVLLFGRYDLNPLFNKQNNSQLPNLNAFVFGIRL